MIIFGTRPEAIKLCPLLIEFNKRYQDYQVIVCITAQHREMLDQIMRVFNIKPDYDLNIMRDNQSLFEITSTALEEVGKVINSEQPDWVIVQGDTATTFASALAAYYCKVPVAHVEAGLRTNDKYSPFPEEINRRLATHIADFHLAPTETNKENLMREGIQSQKILVTGNTVIDALLWVRDKINKEKQNFSELSTIDFKKKVILVTGHRRENFGQGFVNVCEALKEIAYTHKDVQLVYPVHLNPNVKKPVWNILSGINNVKLMKPLDYEPFVYLMDKSYFIISDSGGIQEEAPSLGKPVLVTRNTTERPEAVEQGSVKLVGTNKAVIIEAATSLLRDKIQYSSMSEVKNVYGDGLASKRIVGYFDELFSQ